MGMRCGIMGYGIMGYGSFGALRLLRTTEIELAFRIDLSF